MEHVCGVYYGRLLLVIEVLELAVLDGIKGVSLDWCRVLYLSSVEIRATLVYPEAEYPRLEALLGGGPYHQLGMGEDEEVGEGGPEVGSVEVEVSIRVGVKQLPTPGTEHADEVPPGKVGQTYV